MLTTCLNALSPENQSVSLDEYEIIVTDDSSTNSTQEFIQKDYKWVRYVKGKRKGPAANRNNGASNANGEWLIFIDDDCIPDKYLLKSYLDEFRTSRFEVFEGKIKADRERIYYLEEAPLNLHGGKMWSCNIAIKKVLFNKLNGFDEIFPFAAMEDTDFHYRTQQLNIPIQFVEKAAVIHPWRASPGLEIVIKRQKSFIYFIKKHPTLQKKHTVKWFLLSIKNQFVLHFRYFRFNDLPLFIARVFLIIYLMIRVKTLNLNKSNV
jgi:GT2 family glycosyltransferase